MNMEEDTNLLIYRTQLPHQTQMWVGNEGDPASRTNARKQGGGGKAFSFFLLILKKLINLFLAVLGLCFCSGFSLVVTIGGYSLVAGLVLRLLAVASLVAEHGL